MNTSISETMTRSREIVLMLPRNNTALNASETRPTGMFHFWFRYTPTRSVPPLDPKERSMMPLPVPTRTPVRIAAYSEFCTGALTWFIT